MQKERKDGNPLNLPARCHFKHNAFWYIHAQTGKWENLGADVNKARLKAEHYNRDSATDQTMSWHIDAYLLHFEKLVELQQKAPRTLLDYQNYAKQLKAAFGDLLPEQIQAKQIQAYLTSNQQLGRGVRANREKALLSAVFSWLIANNKGNVSANPCRDIARNQESPQRRYISNEQFQSVRQQAIPAIQLAMDLAYYTLQNPADIIKLRRTAIQTDNDCVYLKFAHPKSGKPLSIALNQQLQDQLKAALGLSDLSSITDSAVILMSRLGKPYTTSGIAAMLHRYQQVAQVNSFGLQDIKIKGALDLIAAGTSIEIVHDLLGHSTMASTQRFLNLPQS